MALRVLITGAGRGIGLAVAREYAERGDHVLAGYRSLDRAPGLRQILAEGGDKVTPIPLDVTANESVAAALRQTSTEIDALDVLINNAGISPGDQQTTIDGNEVLDAETALQMFRVNAVAPLVIAQSFRALLEKGQNPRIINVSSGAGSLALKTDPELYSYSASKAALNMYTRTLAWDLCDRGITVVALDPGWARTDMGGPEADIDPAESAEGVVQLIDHLSLADTGRFFHYQGGEVPW